MTLLDLKENDIVEIRKLPSDVVVAERIHALGLYAGRTVRFIKAGPFSGPILIEDEATGARVMIARTTANTIEVGNARPIRDRASNCTGRTTKLW